MRKILITLILLTAICQAAAAQTVVANTASWENIYSAGIYTALQNKEFKFLVSVRHGSALIPELKNPKVTVIESDRVPFQRNYKERLRQEGFQTDAIIIPEDNGNLDLAKRANVKKYYIVDPRLGYDAISVAPLAIKEKAYVLLATKENINSILQFLNSTAVEKISLVGELDEEVSQALSKYNPEIIRKGSRYKNNIELASRFKKQVNAQQGILTNGEFLVEDIFVAGNTEQPVIFIGKDRPPEESMKFLKGAGFKTTVLIGNDLVNSARRVKDLLQIPLFVKFGKGMTEAGGAFKKVQGLDIYPVPILDLLLQYQGIGYNTATQQVELYIKNEKELRTYLQPAIGILSNGELVATLGDQNPQIIQGKEQIGLTYPAQIGQYIGTNLTAEIVVPYGYTPDEMDQAIERTVPLETIQEEDNCEIEIEDAFYNKETQRFHIQINSNEECFALARMRDLMIDDEQTNPESEVVPVNGKSNIFVKQRMNEIDIADNPEVTVQVRYGSRAGILTKTKEKTFKLKFGEGTELPVDITTISLLGIIALLILILIWQRKRKRY